MFDHLLALYPKESGDRARVRGNHTPSRKGKVSVSVRVRVSVKG